MVTPDTPLTLSQDQADAINALLPTCKYVVGIRHNESGEVRFCPQTLEWNENSLYWWSTGNMSCDCNRHLEFHGRTDECYEDDVPCGETRYTLVGIWFPDGSEYRYLDLLNDF
jgi:hypothetical protein